MNPESVLSHEIRVAVAKAKVATLWRNTTGVDLTRGIRYGLGVGSADLVGFRHSDAKMVAIEVKTAKGRVSVEQKAWLEFTRKHGCLVGVARSIDDALAIIAGVAL